MSTATLEKPDISSKELTSENEEFLGMLGDRDHRLDFEPELEYQYYKYQRSQNERWIQQGRLESIDSVPGLREKMQQVVDALVARGVDKRLLEARLSRLAISKEPFPAPPEYQEDQYGWYDYYRGVVHISPHTPTHLLDHTMVHDFTHGLGASGTIWAYEGSVYCSGSGIHQAFTLEGEDIPEGAREALLIEVDEALTDSFALEGSGMGEMDKKEWGYTGLVKLFKELDQTNPKLIEEIVQIHYGHGITSFDQLARVLKGWYQQSDEPEVSHA
jgi:hypothetical protein